MANRTDVSAVLYCIRFFLRISFVNKLSLKNVLHIYAIRATIIHLSHSQWIDKKERNTFFNWEKAEMNQKPFICVVSLPLNWSVISGRELSLNVSSGASKYGLWKGSTPLSSKNVKQNILSFTRFWLFLIIKLLLSSQPIHWQNLTLGLHSLSLLIYDTILIQ